MQMYLSVCSLDRRGRFLVTGYDTLALVTGGEGALTHLLLQEAPLETNKLLPDLGWVTMPIGAARSNPGAFPSMDYSSALLEKPRMYLNMV